MMLQIALIMLVLTPEAAPPSWATGSVAEFPANAYLIGVGMGPSKEAAAIDARAEISRVFSSQIHSVMQDFQSVATKVDAAGKGVSVELQEVQQTQKVESETTLSGVEIKKRAGDGDVYYALAVMSRSRCLTSLATRIEEVDAKVAAEVVLAESTDKLGALKHYGRAITHMGERGPLDAMYGVCNPNGGGVPAKIGMADLVRHFESVKAGFRFGVLFRGEGAEPLRDCILEKLGDKGYELEEVAVSNDPAKRDEDPDMTGFDAFLDAKVSSQQQGVVAGSVMVRTEVVLRLIDPKTNKTVKTLRASRKEGRRDLASSISLAAQKICKKEAPKIVKAIQQYFDR